jgi:chromate transporter
MDSTHFRPGGRLQPVAFVEALKVWVKVALYSFGGPAGQIGVMHRLLVEEKKWIAESRFLHALNYCMLLPGPEAQQLAIYSGWLLHRTLGGLVAGSLFVLPGFVSILVLSILYVRFQDIDLVAAVFFGLKPAVIAIVCTALLMIGRRVLKNWAMAIIAGLSFTAIFVFDVLFPFIILGAGLAGFLGWKTGSPLFQVLQPKVGAGEEEGAADAAVSSLTDTDLTLRRAVRVTLACVAAWFAPVVLVWVFFGADSIYLAEALFFSKVAVITFGGAYAVLSYIAQQAVENYAWLVPGEMLDGLGMAETTPGPLIQVVQYVGFLGAYRNPAPLSPLAGAVLASVIVTWVTFVPSFLWILVGAPHVERARKSQPLTAALSAVTAAVVGVILHLAVWFSVHTLFAEVREVQVMGLRLLFPQPATLDPGALAIAAGAFLALLVFRAGTITTITLCAAAGIVIQVLIRG